MAWNNPGLLFACGSVGSCGSVSAQGFSCGRVPAAGAGGVCRLSWAHTSKIINGSPGALSGSEGWAPRSTDEARTQGAPTFCGVDCKSPSGSRKPARPRTFSWRLLSTQVTRAALIPRDSPFMRRSGSLESAPPPPAHIRVQPSPCRAVLTRVGWSPTSSSGRMLAAGFAPAW